MNSSNNSSTDALIRSVPDVPNNLINAFVYSYNSHDLNEYKNRFLSHCVKDFKIIKRVYGKADPITGKPKNPFGDFSYLEINGIEQVIYMADRFFNAAPDGIFEVQSQRSCNTNKATVLVGTFKFKGTLIEETPSTELPQPQELLPLSSSSATAALSMKRILPSSSSSSSSSSSTMQQYQRHEELIEQYQVVQKGLFKTKPIASIGSLALYLNEEGRPYCLEFFYEYL